MPPHWTAAGVLPAAYHLAFKKSTKTLGPHHLNLDKSNHSEVTSKDYKTLTENPEVQLAQLRVSTVHCCLNALAWDQARQTHTGNFVKPICGAPGANIGSYCGRHLPLCPTP